MCGRMNHAGLSSRQLFEWLEYGIMPEEPGDEVVQSWNVPPTSWIPILRRDGDGLRPGGHPARHLQLELHEFSQVFDAPGTSVGLVRVLATVASPGADGAPMLAQRSFIAQQPAPSPDAAGGVRALTAASDVVLSDIAQWLSTLR